MRRDSLRKKSPKWHYSSFGYFYRSANLKITIKDTKLNPVDFWGVSLYNKRVGERKKPPIRPGGEDVKQPFRLSVKEANPAFTAHWWQLVAVVNKMWITVSAVHKQDAYAKRRKRELSTGEKRKGRHLCTRICGKFSAHLGTATRIKYHMLYKIRLSTFPRTLLLLII